MFDSPADAAKALQAYFDPPRIEIITKALVPAMVLTPVADGRVVVGGARLGGTPDVPSGFLWPRPPVPDDPEAIAKRGNADAGRSMREHMALNLPYAFVAQIDLAEAAQLGDVSKPLPSEGRLLFFYDFAIGPWETGTRPAHVIWDTSPAKDLAPLARPDDLVRAFEKERNAFAAIRKEFPDPSDTGKHDEGNVYGAPARAVTLRKTYRLPHTSSLEIDALPPELATSARGQSDADDDFESAYEEALEAHHDGYPSEAWRRQQLLGSPMPEQSDPRYDAVVVSEFGKQHLSRDEWATHRDEIMRKAKDWVLLLQVDIGDWTQARFVEGTVYFVIRRDDLERRRFETVVAVYQQT
jgi:hypothetical protein